MRLVKFKRFGRRKKKFFENKLKSLYGLKKKKKRQINCLLRYKHTIRRYMYRFVSRFQRPSKYDVDKKQKNKRIYSFLRTPKNICKYTQVLTYSKCNYFMNKKFFFKKMNNLRRFAFYKRFFVKNGVRFLYSMQGQKTLYSSALQKTIKRKRSKKKFYYKNFLNKRRTRLNERWDLEISYMRQHNLFKKLKKAKKLKPIYKRAAKTKRFPIIFKKYEYVHVSKKNFFWKYLIYKKCGLTQKLRRFWGFKSGRRQYRRRGKFAFKAMRPRFHRRRLKYGRDFSQYLRKWAGPKPKLGVIWQLEMLKKGA